MTRILGGWLVLSIVIHAGCSGDGNDAVRVSVYPVSGKITMAGRPVDGASVTFAPLGEQPIAFATTNAAGEFKLTTYDAEDGAAVGEYSIVILKSAGPVGGASGEQHSTDVNATFGGSHGAGGESSGSATTVVPAQFGTINDTPLKRTIAADGENRFEIDLLK